MREVRVRAGSKRWLRLRDQGIGASEIAAVVGISPYLSASTLYYRKIGALPDLRDNDRMEWGRRLERMILQRWQDDHPKVPVHTGRMLWSDTEPWQFATVDGLAMCDCDIPTVVEVKTAASKEEWGPDGSDEIPVHYRAQVMQQMDVTGARVAYVPCLFNGREYRCYEIGFDNKDAEILRLAGRAFWRRVQEKDPPPVDAHRSTVRAMKDLWGVDSTKREWISTDLAKKYQRALDVFNRAESLVDRYDNQVRESAGDARQIYVGDRIVATRSAWTQKQFDTKKFKEEHPDLFEEYSYDSNRTRFAWRGYEEK